MPNHKSAEKRLRSSEKARVRNKAVRAAIKTAMKKIRGATKKEDALKELPGLFSLMDKAVNKSRASFKANQVSNYKSKIHKHIASIA